MSTDAQFDKETYAQYMDYAIRCLYIAAGAYALGGIIMLFFTETRLVFGNFEARELFYWDTWNELFHGAIAFGLARLLIRKHGLGVSSAILGYLLIEASIRFSIGSYDNVIDISVLTTKAICFIALACTIHMQLMHARALHKQKLAQMEQLAELKKKHAYQYEVARQMARDLMDEKNRKDTDDGKGESDSADTSKKDGDEDPDEQSAEKGAEDSSDQGQKAETDTEADTAATDKDDSDDTADDSKDDGKDSGDDGASKKTSKKKPTKNARTT